MPAQGHCALRFRPREGHAPGTFSGLGESLRFVYFKDYLLAYKLLLLDIIFLTLEVSDVDVRNFLFLWSFWFSSQKVCGAWWSGGTLCCCFLFLYSTSIAGSASLPALSPVSEKANARFFRFSTRIWNFCTQPLSPCGHFLRSRRKHVSAFFPMYKFKKWYYCMK